MFFGHDLKLQTEFTDTSEPVLIIFASFFGFDALGARIMSKLMSSNNIQLLEILNEIFIFELFDFSTDGPLVGLRWPPVGVPPRKVIFPHLWVVNTGCLLVCSESGSLLQFHTSSNSK